MTAAAVPAAALNQRLEAVQPHLDPSGASRPDQDAGTLLSALLAACRRSGSMRDLWLLLVATAGAWPDEQQMRRAARLVPDTGDAAGQLRFLDLAFGIAADSDGGRELDVVTGTVIVDVDFCARHDVHTGIQRVVRETVPRWAATHDILPVAWTDAYSSMRLLYEHEVPNVMAYQPRSSPPLPFSERAEVAPAATRLVVPLDCTIVLPEIPEPEASDVYAAAAQWSGNRLVAVGYDMIPVVSADLRPGWEATRFVRYLGAVKHADAVAGISRSATAEFAGFARTLPAQGLRGPRVLEVFLPASAPDQAATTVPKPPTGRPVIVCVGTHDPHKNHGVLVHAAERLWRQGLDFELVFAGGPGFGGPHNLCYEPLLRAHRPVRVLGRITDTELTALLASASFSVFLSLHEGYGLPVAESLACGTPVVTSNYGSLQEIAEGGGCVTVDPRDDDAATAAIGDLVRHPEKVAALRAEIVTRAPRTWDAYAAELWQVVEEVS